MSVCMYLFVCLCMCVVYVYMGGCTLFACGSQRRMISVLLYPSPSYSFENVLITEPRPKLADNKTQKPFFFCPHNAEVINRLAQSHFAFSMVLGI